VSYRETEIHNSLLGFWLAVVSRGFFYLWFESFPGEVAPSNPRLFTLPWSSCVKIRDCQTFFISPSLALETCVNKLRYPNRIIYRFSGTFGLLTVCVQVILMSLL